MRAPTLSAVLKQYHQAAAKVEYEEFMDRQHKAATMRHALSLLKRATPALEWLGYTAPFQDLGFRIIMDSTYTGPLLLAAVSEDENANDQELLAIKLVPGTKASHSISLVELLTVYHLATGVEL